MNKKLKFEDLVPNNTVGIAKVTPTVTNMPNAAPGNVSYTSLIKNDTVNTGAPYRVDAFEPKTTYNGGGLNDGEGGNGGGTGETVPKMTYEEWYNTAKQNAETTRQNAIGDAQVNYNKSKSEYGNRAESLRNMGLTGAGYSDYLNGQAYAQMQGAIANANAQKASTIADIDAKYMDYLEQKNAAAKEEAAKTQANYANLLSNITYAWTDADIDNYAAAYGLTDESLINTLKQTRLDRVKRFLDTNDYDISTLKMLLPEGSEEYKYYMSELGKKGLNDKLSFYDETGKNLVSKAEAQKALDGFATAGYDTKSAQSEFDRLYGISDIANGHYVTLNTAKGSGNFKADKEGDNFEVAYSADWGGEIFKVKNGGKVEDANVITVAENVRNNQVFYYNGNIYMKHGGNIYKIVARKDTNNFDRLIKLFEDNYKR